MPISAASGKREADRAGGKVPTAILKESSLAATLRFLQIFSLGTWVGSILFFSFVVTQGAFSVLPNNDLAGALVGYTLTKLHMIGIVAGVVYLLSTAASERSIGALAHPAALLVFVMIRLHDGFAVRRDCANGRIDACRWVRWRRRLPGARCAWHSIACISIPSGSKAPCFSPAS